MNTLKTMLLAGLMIIGLQACNNTSKKSAETAETVPMTKLEKAINHTGLYVCEGYAKRAEGSDWVSINVSPAEAEQLKIEVRSRTDIKKTTCTFDAVADRKNDSTYVAVHEGKNILFTFTDADLTIATENPEDSDMLHFFCSGGATLAGTYAKFVEEKAETEATVGDESTQK